MYFILVSWKKVLMANGEWAIKDLINLAQQTLSLEFDIVK